MSFFADSNELSKRMPGNYKLELVGVLGHPVAENPTCVMQEAAFTALGLPWRYLTINVPPAALPDAIRGVRGFGMQGVNLTIPHKVAVLPLLDEVSPDAARIGAVNTVRREGNRLIGENTDGKGFLRGLREVAGMDPAGANVLLLGAGGAARAIAFELAAAGVSKLAICNRSASRGAALCEDLKNRAGFVARFQLWPGLCAVGPEVDILVGTRLNLDGDSAASGVTYAIIGTSRVPTNGDAAILGQQLANAQVYGVQGYISNSTGTGAGVFGSNAGPGATGSTYKGFASGVWGDAGTFGTIGVLATADNGNGVVAYNNSSVVSAVVGENLNTSNSSTALAPGVYGISSAPLGLGVIGSGPVHSSTFNSNVGFNPVGVVGDSSAAAGIGVWGVTDAGTSVYGSTNTGTGLYGLSNSGTGVLGVSNTGIGVSGASTISAGVAGSSPAAGNSGVYGLTTNTDLSNASYGVWGDDPTTNGFNAGTNGGVYGFSEAGDGVIGVTNSGVALFNFAGSFYASNGATPLLALSDLNSCQVNNRGDLICTGSKSAAVPLSDNRWVRLYAVESPENWFEDFGSGTLSNGSASVALEPTFRDTVTSSQDYHVFLTPRGM